MLSTVIFKVHLLSSPYIFFSEPCAHVYIWQMTNTRPKHGLMEYCSINSLVLILLIQMLLCPLKNKVVQ